MVKVVRSCLVSPAVETPRHGVWLSNLDLFAPPAHTPTVYFYRRPDVGECPGFFSPEALKDGLSKALVSFYLFSGRLGIDAAGRREIQCNGKGALFVEAESDLTVDQLGDFAPSPRNRQLFVPTVNADDGDDAIPLLLIQVTFFKCGGVCLGVGVHHYVSDGVASLHFINAWSDVTRGIGVAVPPSLDRTVLRPRSPPAVLFAHPEYKRNPQSNNQNPVSAAILGLSADQLAAVKSAASSGKTRHSTYEAVAAHVWRCACRARGLGAGEETRAYITADGRSRLRPPLPQGFIGNAIFPAAAVALAGEVAAGAVEGVAGRIRRAIGRLDDEYLRSALDLLELQDDVRKLGRWAGNFPSTDLSIVSWTRLPIYEADFGWGRPAYMGPASFFYAGLCYIMPTPNAADGGVRVAVSMESERMGCFKKLFYELGTGCGSALVVDGLMH